MRWKQDLAIDGEPIKNSFTVYVGANWWLANVSKKPNGLWYSVAIHDGELESYRHRSKAAAMRAAEKRLNELQGALKTASKAR